MTAWMEHAACRHPEADPEVFFPHVGGTPNRALDWCRDCPVTSDCLTYALADPHTYGVWGGHMFTGLRPRPHRKATA